jgi:hypothetical protein
MPHGSAESFAVAGRAEGIKDFNKPSELLQLNINDANKMILPKTRARRGRGKAGNFFLSGMAAAKKNSFPPSWIPPTKEIV